MLFTYTPTGQRESVTDARGTTTYEYDERNRLLSRTDPDGVQISYSYDAAGNRTSLTVPSGTTAFTFDTLNRLETVTDPDLDVTWYPYDFELRVPVAKQEAPILLAFSCFTNINLSEIRAR